MVFGMAVVRKLTLMLKSLTHTLLVMVPPVPVSFTENMNCVYKNRSYEARIREDEQSSFTPSIFSATGGMANEATMFYKHLASLLSDKWDSNYAAVMGWIRCCLSFHF